MYKHTGNNRQIETSYGRVGQGKGIKNEKLLIQGQSVEFSIIEEGAGIDIS